MTLLDHVYAVKNIVSHGPASKDFSYSDRLIAHFLQVARGKLTLEKINKYSFISNQSYQDLCIDLEKSSYHNCCGTETDCYVLKSTKVIPKFLTSRWGNFIKVTDLTGLVLSEISLTQTHYSEYALTPQKVGWFMHNNYLYVVNSNLLSKILINALFDDPQAVAQLNCPTSTDVCDVFAQEFPVDADIVDAMYKITIEYLMTSQKIPKDDENNANDESVLYGA